MLQVVVGWYGDIFESIVAEQNVVLCRGEICMHSVKTYLRYENKNRFFVFVFFLVCVCVPIQHFIVTIFGSGGGEGGGERDTCTAVENGMP